MIQSLSYKWRLSEDHVFNRKLLFLDKIRVSEDGEIANVKPPRTEYFIYDHVSLRVACHALYKYARLIAVALFCQTLLKRHRSCRFIEWNLA